MLDCNFTANGQLPGAKDAAWTENGGAIATDGTRTSNLYPVNLVVRRSTFVNNKAVAGGAIMASQYSRSKGRVEVHDCRFSGNTVSFKMICCSTTWVLPKQGHLHDQPRIEAAAVPHLKHGRMPLQALLSGSALPSTKHCHKHAATPSTSNAYCCLIIASAPGALQGKFDGGAVMIEENQYTELVLNASSFENNQGDFGGAVSAYDADVAATNCSFIGNKVCCLTLQLAPRSCGCVCCGIPVAGGGAAMHVRA